MEAEVFVAKSVRASRAAHFPEDEAEHEEEIPRGTAYSCAECYHGGSFRDAAEVAAHRRETGHTQITDLATNRNMAAVERRACPDCNPDSGPDGDPGCPVCHGAGWLENPRVGHLGPDLGFHDSIQNWEKALDTESAPDVTKKHECATCGGTWQHVWSDVSNVYVRRHEGEPGDEPPTWAGPGGHRPIDEHEIIRGVTAGLWDSIDKHIEELTKDADHSHTLPSGGTSYCYRGVCTYAEDAVRDREEDAELERQRQDEAEDVAPGDPTEWDPDRNAWIGPYHEGGGEPSARWKELREQRLRGKQSSKAPTTVAGLRAHLLEMHGAEVPGEYDSELPAAGSYRQGLTELHDDDHSDNPVHSLRNAYMREYVPHSHGDRTASTGADCSFEEKQPGQWHYRLQQYPYGQTEDYDEYGPFPTLDKAQEHLSDNHANPGGSYTRGHPESHALGLHKTPEQGAREGCGECSETRTAEDPGGPSRSPGRGSVRHAVLLPDVPEGRRHQARRGAAASAEGDLARAPAEAGPADVYAPPRRPRSFRRGGDGGNTRR